MDIEKEREAFERHKFKDQYDELKAYYDEHEREFGYRYPSYTYDDEWEIWLAAKAQAVQEQDQQVWATSNLTWKDIAFRALSCKVLKSTENWVHVKNIACVGSTTASLICKKLGVDPDGTKFELIEAQEPAND
ncbi:hypothetical protein HX112_03120 [Acinetobacter towneri]|uniref:hypothetical protein n=1 Tax=Acinetobacter towneri TaxID=202956 RepID=UPI002576CA6F|nr:hypothetical protein [Acinetobacter towneri]MDM1735564.1 hypothetical protein [Acinetobacter towneri]